jgi:Domain of unknown function (DUF4410)
MKYSLLALCTSLLLASCAGTKIVQTDIATGATNPKAIYVRPFDVADAAFYGQHNGGHGEWPIRKSLAPAEFAIDLRNELSKLAPSMVLKNDEMPPRVGWLVVGYFEIINSGNPEARTLIGTDAGASHVRLHVRILDLESGKKRGDAKDADEARELAQGKGNIIYEFTVEGGSHCSAALGSIYAPGLGYAVPFDFKNAAERIMMALSTDPHRLGQRDSTIIRP